MINRTLLMIKPDIVEKKGIGKVITFIEQHDIKIIDIKLFKFSKRKAEMFYSEHKGKKFYNELENFILSNYVVVIILEGIDIVNTVRTIIGHTDPQKAEKNTIRKLFATNMTKNAVHASDSIDSFKREYEIVFGNK